VVCARTINSTRKIVTLNPSASLSASTDYLVIVPGVVDVHGQSLANTVINFTTAS
jgi:ribosomal silencing factor RsfS